MCNPVTDHVMSLPVCTLISCPYFNTIVIALPFTGNDRSIRLMVGFEGMLESPIQITLFESPMEIILMHRPSEGPIGPDRRETEEELSPLGVYRSDLRVEINLFGTLGRRLGALTHPPPGGSTFLC